MIQTSLTPTQASQEPLLTLKQDCEAPHTKSHLALPGALLQLPTWLKQNTAHSWISARDRLHSALSAHQKISRQNKDELLAARTPQPLLL